MSPRPYRLGRREAAAEATRERIIEAARALLAREEDFSGFSLDAVAREAGVARVTVYYQFESKPRLLEALFDAMAAKALVQPLMTAMAQDDPVLALDGLVEAFAAFWAADRLAIRRIRGLSALDAEIGATHNARDERRRGLLTVLARRLTESGASSRAGETEVNTVQMLTSFQAFDALAGDGRSPLDVVPQVQSLARTVFGIGEDGARAIDKASRTPDNPPA